MSEKERTLVVGIDGGCWPYLNPLLESGQLPAIQKLVTEGVHGILESTMPPVTPVAWTSFATGKNPGKHGIFSWLWRRPGTWEFLPFSGSQRVGSPWWSYLNDKGLRVGLVNIPMTYPPAPLEGFTICGFGAPASASNLTYPETLYRELSEKFDWSGDVVSQSIPLTDGGWQAFEAGKIVQDKNVRSAIYLADKHQVDVLAINLMLLDHCNHLASDEAVLQQAIRQCDQHLSELIQGFQPDNVMVFSDHGSRRVTGEFLLGLWLQDNGYLLWDKRTEWSKADLNWLLIGLFRQHLNWTGWFEKLARGLTREFLWFLPPATMAQFWKSAGPKTPALYAQYLFKDTTDFARSPFHLEDWGSIYLNIIGRDPEGVVVPTKEEQLRHELVERLLSISDPETNTPLFSRVYQSHDLYDGQLTKFAPDLALDYFSSCWSLTKGMPANVQTHAKYFTPPRERWHGDHTRQGLFILSGGSFGSKNLAQTAHITDIPATLLYLLGCSIPEDWDGLPLLNLMAPRFVDSHQVTSQTGDDPTMTASDYDFSEQEIAQISEHLRALGYLN